MTQAITDDSPILRNNKRQRSQGITRESLPNLSEDSRSPSQGAGSPTSKCDKGVRAFVVEHRDSLYQLYATSVEAKIWGVCAMGLNRPSPPTLYPEYTKPDGIKYVYRELEFWTSGFFPGSLHLLLERRRKWWYLTVPAIGSVHNVHDIQLEYACQYWTESLHQNAQLRTTHDLGFMIMPWAKLAFELNRDFRALETIKTAAATLLSRFNSTVGCIRSWDTCVTKKYNFDNTDTDFLVVIDNMMNLNLLFYAASKTGNANMYLAAVEHARTTARTHVRTDASTTHLVAFDPKTGNVKQRLTNQGYAHNSCWARGQAWAIAGFAETFGWTRDGEFLETARRCADYFLDRLPINSIVPWDFDALENEGPPQPPDTSAAMIASYGLLLIHQALVAQGQESRYLMGALAIIQAVCSNHVNDSAQFMPQNHAVETVEYGTTINTTMLVDVSGGETVLNGATINNYEFAPRRWVNHGLVYADYYFLLVGNLLMEMGLGAVILKDCTRGVQ